MICCRIVAYFQKSAQELHCCALLPSDMMTVAMIIIANIIAERLDFVKERGFGAIGPLMGVVMGAAKGADGREVSERLKAAIQQVLS